MPFTNPVSVTGSALPTAVTLPTVGTLLIASRVAGDTDDRYELAVDGTQLWGPGAGPPDTQLGRIGAALLQVTGRLRATLGFETPDSRFTIDQLGALTWGPSGGPGDVSLSRVGTGALRAAGSLEANGAGLRSVGVGGLPRFYVKATDYSADSKVWDFLPIGGSNFQLRAINDAETNSATVFQVTRTGLATLSFDVLVPLNGTSIATTGNIGTTGGHLRSIGVGGVPRSYYKATDAAADNKVWDILPNGDLFIRAINDAENAANTVLRFYRTGMTIAGASFWGSIATGSRTPIGVASLVLGNSASDANAGTPAAGDGVLYCLAGALRWKGGSGTITQIAPA